MLRLTALAIVLATPAAAELVKVSECAYEDPENTTRVLACDLKNTGEEAVSRLGYGFRISDPSRTIPWAEIEWEQPPGRSILHRDIAGGLEPGETIRKMFRGADIPERAEIDNTTPEIRIHDVYDAEGELITAPH